MDERKKSSWGVWGSAALFFVLLGYPLSCGPTVYVLQRLARTVDDGKFNSITAPVEVFYSPLGWGIRRCPKSINDAYGSYINWWNDLAQY